jgi:hypothetical protein
MGRGYPASSRVGLHNPAQKAASRASSREELDLTVIPGDQVPRPPRRAIARFFAYPWNRSSQLRAAGARARTLAARRASIRRDARPPDADDRRNEPNSRPDPRRPSQTRNARPKTSGAPTPTRGLDPNDVVTELCRRRAVCPFPQPTSSTAGAGTRAISLPRRYGKSPSRPRRAVPEHSYSSPPRVTC